jgi:hypothetical protein
VEPVIDLAPGAEHDALARTLAETVRANVKRDWQRREFSRLRGSAAIVADDAGTALTLRFDFGRLTIHEGLVGVPDVTIRGSTAEIEALTRLRFGTPLRLPLGAEAGGIGELTALVRAIRSDRLKIYGLVLHARFVVRLLRILSRCG